MVASYQHWLLKKHIKWVHEGIKPHHKCDLCSKTFGCISLLNDHIRCAHHGIKDWQCDTCGKEFTKISHLKRHKLNVHKNASQSIIDTNDWSFKTNENKY